MPSPTYAFTIPSLDDLPLDCRLFVPTKTRVIGKCALVSHPYAPLGGSYDDAVVEATTESLLESGWVVGTLNFRGAAGSKGSTSWTGKGERDDCTSFTGFMIYYMHFLLERQQQNRDNDGPSGSLGGGERPSRNIEICLAGYSYGSLIISRFLPSLSDIVQIFESAMRATAPAEVILRARRLAKETFETVLARNPSGDALATPPSRHRRVDTGSPVMMGGEETDSSERRSSNRSIDVVRKAAKVPHRIKVHLRRHSSTSDVGMNTNDRAIEPTSDPNPDTPKLSKSVLAAVSVRYLLVSPLLPPLSYALCLPHLTNRDSSKVAGGMSDPRHKVLAVFGSVDTFTSGRRLRTWAEKLSEERGGWFQWTEIEKAGHFWREDGVMEALQERICTWLKQD